jgi:hypothetical protein
MWNQPLPPVFAPRQRDNDGVEDRECNQARTRIERNPVQLIADEDQQDNDQARIRPELIQQEGDDEHDLHCAMCQQVNGTEEYGAAGQSICGMQYVVGDDVVGIFGQFTLSYHRSQMMDTARVNEEQKQPTHELDNAVEALGDDADLEDTVQPVRGFEHLYFPARQSNALGEFLVISL